MQLHAKKVDLQNRNVQLIVVGNGPSHFIDGFKDSSGFTGTVLTDPKREMFRLLGFKTSKRAVFKPKVLLNGVRAFTGGHRQKGVKGDPWQQGGILIVDKDLTVLYLHRYEAAGETIPWQNIWNALK